MSRARLVIFILVIIALAGAAWLLLARSKSEAKLSGYIEADSLFLAAPVAGTIDSITATEGQRIAAGHRLFIIAPATLSAESEQAQAQVLGATTQIAAAAANAEQAEAEAALKHGGNP